MRNIRSLIRLTHLRSCRFWHLPLRQVLFCFAACTALLGLTAISHSQSTAERLGPHFLHGWTTSEQETLAEALRALEGKPGIDDYLMERQARILRKLEVGGEVYPLAWPPLAPFTLHSAAGDWRIYQLSLPEMILSGIAVSRGCPRNNDAEQCALSLELFSKSFDNAKAIYPGGNTR